LNELNFASQKNLQKITGTYIEKILLVLNKKRFEETKKNKQRNLNKNIDILFYKVIFPIDSTMSSQSATMLFFIS
jgi:hypothetical protein